MSPDFRRTTILSPYGGPRVDACTDGSAGSPRRARYRHMITSFVTTAKRRIRPPQPGHPRTSRRNVRVRSAAHVRFGPPRFKQSASPGAAAPSPFAAASSTGGGGAMREHHLLARASTPTYVTRYRVSGGPPQPDDTRTRSGRSRSAWAEARSTDRDASSVSYAMTDKERPGRCSDAATGRWESRARPYLRRVWLCRKCA